MRRNFCSFVTQYLCILVLCRKYSSLFSQTNSNISHSIILCGLIISCHWFNFFLAAKRIQSQRFISELFYRVWILSTGNFSAKKTDFCSRLISMIISRSISSLSNDISSCLTYEPIGAYRNGGRNVFSRDIYL